MVRRPGEFSTVKPESRKRTLSNPESVHLRKVSAYHGTLKVQCFYVAGTITKCPLRGGIHLGRCSPREVSLSEGPTILSILLAQALLQ